VHVALGCGLSFGLRWDLRCGLLSRIASSLFCTCSGLLWTCCTSNVIVVSLQSSVWECVYYGVWIVIYLKCIRLSLVFSNYLSVERRS
jgi:hypothetical protein